MNNKNLGFTTWFEEKADSVKVHGCAIVRIITINKSSCIVSNGKKDIFAKTTGKLSFAADTPLAYPAVGDWVHAQLVNDGTFALIHEIIPRKSLLKRKTSGKKIDIQLIAANIDTALIMQSLDANYNINRLERYIAMALESSIEPFVLLSKSDLLSPEEIDDRIAAIHETMPNLQIRAFSNMDDESVNSIREILLHSKTYCLLGSSGVGKTTLLNKLISKDLYKTNPVREKDGKGRHTTSRRQLIVLENGALIIDTPGMRELGNLAIETGIDNTFSEITQLSLQCRYRDCTHTQEKGCAVLHALNNGTITEQRYENYIKMKKESAYYDMSYVEKRQKDKQFGKMIKTVMKIKDKKRPF